jgi:hypothetical protein
MSNVGFQFLPVVDLMVEVTVEEPIEGMQSSSWE